MPISVTPVFVVVLYDWLMWLTEPVWLVMEVLGVAKLTIGSSKVIIDRMDDKPVLAKGCIVFISGVCYCIMFSLFWTVAFSMTDDVKMFLAPIVVVAALVHIAVWFSDAGVISDAAVISAFSMSLLYSMIYEIQDYKWAHSHQDWRSIDEGMSFSRLLITTFTSSLSSMNQAWSFLLKLFHPWFLATALVRCYSVMFAVSWLKSWLKKDDDDDSFLFESESEEDDEEDEDFGTHNRVTTIVTWRSPLLTRLVIIFVYTQLIINHIQAPGLLRSRSFGAHGELSLARMGQIVFANCHYLFYLYREHYPYLYEY